MTDYHYPNISCGYLGEHYKGAAVNSAFFYEISKNKSLLNADICFPQRVPKIGYFRELRDLECENFSKKFDLAVNQILFDLHTTIDNQLKNKKLINLLYLMMRYSLFDAILNLQFPNTSHACLGSEIKLIKEFARIEKCISCGDAMLNINTLIEFSQEAMYEKRFDKKLNLLLLNRIIVLVHRHHALINPETLTQVLSQHILDINNYQPNSLNDYILLSIIYRGIAMASSIGEDKQEMYLFCAENYARNLVPQAKWQQLVVIDNLCTCLQTLSKWHLSKNRFTQAETCLREMCELDPYDSAGYCEMGMLLGRLERHKEAEEYFRKAAELGPPGVGMNTYFRAKCIEKTTSISEADPILRQAYHFDKNAISPLLDLFYHYKNNHNQTELQKIISTILSSPVLVDQLTEQELAEIRR